MALRQAPGRAWPVPQVVFRDLGAINGGQQVEEGAWQSAHEIDAVDLRRATEVARLATEPTPYANGWLQAADDEAW